MGKLKQLLPFADRPVIRHCLDKIISSGVDEIVAVLPENGSRIRDAIAGLPVTIIFNSDPESDMAGSVKKGLRAIGTSATGVLICLADHPLVSEGTFRTLIASHRQCTEKIIVPTFGGKSGHPVLFPRNVIEEIYHSSTMREIILRDEERVRYIDLRDEGVLFDMDTREDYRRMLERVSHG